MRESSRECTATDKYIILNLQNIAGTSQAKTMYAAKSRVIGDYRARFSLCQDTPGFLEYKNFAPLTAKFKVRAKSCAEVGTTLASSK